MMGATPSYEMKLCESNGHLRHPCNVSQIWNTLTQRFLTGMFVEDASQIDKFSEQLGLLFRIIGGILSDKISPIGLSK